MEKDQVRGNDSLVTFEEILQIAKEKNVSLHNIGLPDHSVTLYKFNFISLICKFSKA